jgi:hypothetical protein
MNIEDHRTQLRASGFTIMEVVYAPEQLHAIISHIDSANKDFPIWNCHMD